MKENKIETKSLIFNSDTIDLLWMWIWVMDIATLFLTPASEIISVCVRFKDEKRNN